MTVNQMRMHGFHRKHPIDQSSSLKDFHKYMTSMDGPDCPPRTSNQATSAVSKYLYYFDNDKVKFEYVTDETKITSYISSLKNKTSVQASTLLFYINAIRYADEFVTHTGISRIHSESRVSRTMQRLKRNLRKPLQRRKSYNRSKISPNQLPRLQDIHKLNKLAGRCDKLLVSTCALDKFEMNFLTSFVGSCILLRNCQRESALINMTLNDFNSGSWMESDGEKIYQFSVAYHKNLDSLACFNLKPRDYQMMQKYISKCRAQITSSTDPAGLLFVNTAGKKIANFSTTRHLYQIQKMCGMKQFSLTDYRKAVETCASQNIADLQLVQWIHELLNHSAQVAEEYYMAFTTPKRKLQAFMAIQKMTNIDCQPDIMECKVVLYDFNLQRKM